MTSAARSRRALLARFRAGPPGILFYALTSVAALVAVDGISRADFGALILAALIWAWIGIALVIRFLAAGVRERWRFRRTERIRWLGVPLIAGALFLASRSDALLELRFDLSRRALDEMAADVTNGGTVNRGWVGLYDVGTVAVTENGLRFVVGESLARWGWAFASDGTPVFIDDEEDEAGLWTSPQFKPTGDGWWSWSQGWD